MFRLVKEFARLALFVLFLLPATVIAQPGEPWQNYLVSEGANVPDITVGSGIAAITYTKGDGGDLFVRMSKTSSLSVSTEVQVTESPSNAFDPDIVWNGKSFGVFWYESGKIYYSEISSRGEILTPEKEIGLGVHVSADWNNKTKEYGITWWSDSYNGIAGTVFARANRSGDLNSSISSISIENDGGYYRPRIAAYNNGYGLIWQSSRYVESNLYFEPKYVALDNQGASLFPVMKSSELGYESPWSITWNGNGYAAVLTSFQQVKMISFDESGTKTLETALSGFTYPHYFGVTWLEGKYIVTFQDNIGTVDGNVYLGMYDVNGIQIGEFEKISSSTGFEWNVSQPVMSGTKLYSTWTGNTETPVYNVYFTQGDINTFLY